MYTTQVAVYLANQDHRIDGSVPGTGFGPNSRFIWKREEGIKAATYHRTRGDALKNRSPLTPRADFILRA
ncbi:MAG: hypothetical protein ACREXX_15255 [Gammaproteobacteria bacterium]